MEGRLLLVDDDPGVLDLLNEYFAGQGYDVEVATSGALGELRLLLKLAVELGDLPTAGRDAVAAALERVGGGAPAA